MRHKLLLPYKLYFHPEVRTYTPFSIYALLAHERPVTLPHVTYMNTPMIRDNCDYNFLAVTSVTISDTFRQVH